MNVNTTLGMLSAIAFSLPVLIIILSRLFVNISLIALVLYFLIALSSNLVIENLLAVSADTKIKIAVLNNYFDVPLILTSMLMFCSEKWTEKLIKAALGVFLVYETVILFTHKLSPVSSEYVLGPGIILILAFSSYFFMKNIKRTIMQGKGIGKTLMIASILFAYGSYLLVYIFAYVQKTSDKADVFIIYYITSIIFSVLMSAGLVWIKKRFQEIKEVQVTRKELNVFFNHPKKHRSSLQ